MATTQNTFTGDGSNLGPFSFTFKWLESTDIKVTVAGVLKTAGTHYNLQGLNYTTKTGGQVLFTAGNAPANGAAIVVYRQTDDSDLAATFYSGSAIRAQDLNNNFVQGLYVTQESSNNATTAIGTANTALTNSNTAISTANGAVSTANTASTNASAAVATANTANTNASAAVSTANTANTNATAAVNTANTASSNASTALSTANTALSTANTASTNATTAISTANTASTNASAAVSTANTAASNASAAVSTANTASSNASTALSTANTAISTANAAASAVANAILYDIVANVAAIPASPANNDAVEVTDSTGIQSFTPLTGVPAGFVGSSGLSVRLVYTTTGSTWNWIQYFPNDPETRYLKLAGGTLTGDLTVANQGDIRLGEATANGSNYVAIQAPSSLAANVTYTLPSADGTSGQLLSTNGSGALSWATTSNDIIQEGNSSAEVIDTGSDGRFVVTTEGSERLRVDSSGRLGIGTTSPGELLHVYNSAATSRLIVGPSGTGAATPNALALEQENTGYTVCHVRNLYNNAGLGELRLGGYGFTTFTSGSSQTERARIDSSGRLLVGTSSPRSWSGVTSNIQLEGTDFNASSISQTLNSNNDNGAYLALNKSRGTSNGSQTVVQSGDQVGAIYFNGADGSSLRQAARIEAIVDGTPGASDMPGRLVFSTTSDGAAVSTERLRIANDGKMGFGTTTLTGKFNFDGSVFLFSQPSGAGNSTLKFNTSTGAVTYDTSSRLVKQNIEDCPYGLVELAQLKPRKYFRTDDQKIEIGFVADEVANVLPEFVPIGPKYIITKNEVDTEEIPLGVNYEKLTAVLTKALQETISEIESLKARVAALESPTTTLEIPVDPSSTDI